jgi:hypothetical protein
MSGQDHTVEMMQADAEKMFDDFVEKLCNEQVPLPPEFEEILRNNLWELTK